MVHDVGFKGIKILGIILELKQTYNILWGKIGQCQFYISKIIITEQYIKMKHFIRLPKQTLSLNNWYAFIFANNIYLYLYT